MMYLVLPISSSRLGAVQTKVVNRYQVITVDIYIFFSSENLHCLV